jgi:hypothetical protein
MAKPTIINTRKSVLGNLVFLSGELDINEGGGLSAGFDFSDHVSRILDFDFITGSSTTEMEQMQVHDKLKNSSNEQIFNFQAIQSNISESDGSLRGVLATVGNNYTDNSTPLKVAVLNGGSGYTDGTHSNQSLTGQDSGANNGRATVIVSGGIVNSVQITTAGSNYYDMEKITVAAPNGSGAEILAYGAGPLKATIPVPAQFFPIIIDNTTVKIINFFSDNGDGGTLVDSNAATARKCEFTLIGKR